MKKDLKEFIGTFWLVFGDWVLAQLWLFITIPMAGAMAAGFVYKELSV